MPVVAIGLASNYQIFSYYIGRKVKTVHHEHFSHNHYQLKIAMLIYELMESRRVELLNEQARLKDAVASLTKVEDELKLIDEFIKTNKAEPAAEQSKADVSDLILQRKEFERKYPNFR